ncbi:hypothetical protein [Nostoc sp. CCY 9925]|uniref:hypothetical protein n=1 Tax=Nostoc sp. CCY 9925 TaxID=3103865 RepID=UPI0039C6BB10
MTSVFETIQNSDVRQLGINPNHWYIVALSSEVINKPVSVVVWKQAMSTTGYAYALYRDSIDKIWSISQLFFPALRKLHSEPLNVSYVYPHWVSTLGKDFKIYCLLCPVNERQTKAYLIHFTSLNAFWRLHKLLVEVGTTQSNYGLLKQDAKFLPLKAIQTVFILLLLAQTVVL